MRHALTIDVEEYFQIHAFAGVIPTSEWGVFPAVQGNTDRILDLLDEGRLRDLLLPRLDRGRNPGSSRPSRARA